MEKVSIEGIIVDGIRYDVKDAVDPERTCSQCAFCMRELEVCLYCGTLFGQRGYLVESEKLFEP